MRLYYSSVIVVLLGVAGCGGGNSNVAPPPSVPTARPTTGPTAVPSTTPTAVATATPTAAPSSLPTGGTLSYAGTMSQTTVTKYANPAPQPTGTPIVQGTVTLSWSSQQTVTVGPASGSSGAFDAHVIDVETGTAPNPAAASQIVSDTIYTLPSSGIGNVVQMSVSSTTGTPNAGPTPSFYSDQLVTTYPAGRIVDVLPLTSAASWSNTDYHSETENAPGGNQTVRAVATDGSYTQTTIQPPLPNLTPGPAPSPAPTLFAFQEASNGSGTYSTRSSLASPAPPNSYTYTFSATSPIAIAYQVNGGTFQQLPTVSTWYTVPLTLYSETDVATLGVTIPCQTPPAIGTTARQISTHWTRVDTIFGTIETRTLNTYEVPGVGVVCTTANDIVSSYYDYTSGAYNANPQYSGSPQFSSTIWKTVTTSQTLALTASPTASGVQRAQDSIGGASLVRPSTIAVDRAIAQQRHGQTIQMINALLRGATE